LAQAIHVIIQADKAYHVIVGGRGGDKCASFSLLLLDMIAVIAREREEDTQTDPRTHSSD
jgi:hypothetical protein